jgi:hypothetical protein
MQDLAKLASVEAVEDGDPKAIAKRLQAAIDMLERLPMVLLGDSFDVHRRLMF